MGAKRLGGGAKRLWCEMSWSPPKWCRTNDWYACVLTAWEEIFRFLQRSPMMLPAFAVILLMWVLNLKSDVRVRPRYLPGSVLWREWSYIVCMRVGYNFFLIFSLKQMKKYMIQKMLSWPFSCYRNCANKPTLFKYIKVWFCVFGRGIKIACWLLFYLGKVWLCMLALKASIVEACGICECKVFHVKNVLEKKKQYLNAFMLVRYGMILVWYGWVLILVGDLEISCASIPLYKTFLAALAQCCQYECSILDRW